MVMQSVCVWDCICASRKILSVCVCICSGIAPPVKGEEVHQCSLSGLTVQTETEQSASSAEL